MSDPRRLLSDGSSDFERALLRSWEQEQPTAAARAKTLAIAGMGAATVAAAIKSAGAASGSLAPKAVVGAGAVMKWIALGTLLVAAGGTVAYVQHSSTHAGSSAPNVSPVAQRIAPAAPVANAAPDTPAAAAPVLAERPTVAPHMPARQMTPRAASTLGEQVTALDHARRALADGDPRGALRIVEDYEARFPHGSLSEEAEVVRIEALVAAGDHTSAERAASRFLAAHPGSPHASHVRALVGEP